MHTKAPAKLYESNKMRNSIKIGSEVQQKLIAYDLMCTFVCCLKQDKLEKISFIKINGTYGTRSYRHPNALFEIVRMVKAKEQVVEGTLHYQTLAYQVVDHQGWLEKLDEAEYR
ncbi:hypothetical protein F2Q70_00026516 [Brassica cretica]|uniref:Uncharacterized protein n=1 Tax=Brassica cretica TaxID=69181 RepID=A0A8S9L5Y0_BRACR|nr:hypothetical protein F2Q70_00026516 [Brassica cretica]